MSRFDDLINQRVKVIGGVAVILLAFAMFLTYHESYLDKHQIVGVGKLVKVKNGFYEDCKGIVLKEVYSDVVTDRQGVVHPSIFAGYDVDLTCNNEHTGDRFFTPDFLRVVQK